MKYTKKIKIGKIIVYLVLMALVTYFLIFFHSHLFMMLLVLMALSPVISIPCAVLLKDRISFKLSAPEEYSENGEVCYIQISVINPTMFLTLDTEFELFIENTFLSSGSHIKMSVPCRVKNTYTCAIPLRITENGLVHTSVTRVTITDLLGFVEFGIPVDLKADINVVPASADTHEKKKDIGDISAGTTETEETNKRGYDFSDVSDVREYIPGDRLNSIHWKLSAKKDVLMVKDRESMSDEQMVLAVDLCGGKEQVNAAVDAAYGIIKDLLSDGVFVRMVWLDIRSGDLRERKIINLHEVNEAFADMYDSHIYSEGPDLREYVSRIMPQLRAFVRICSKDGDVDAVVEDLE